MRRFIEFIFAFIGRDYFTIHAARLVPIVTLLSSLYNTVSASHIRFAGVVVRKTLVASGRLAVSPTTRPNKIANFPNVYHSIPT